MKTLFNVQSQTPYDSWCAIGEKLLRNAKKSGIHDRTYIHNLEGYHCNVSQENTYYQKSELEAERLSLDKK